MANMSCNTLYIEGPTHVVDQFLRDSVIGCALEQEREVSRAWYESDRLIDWVVGFDFTTVGESHGFKTVQLGFETKWQEPLGLLLDMIRKYHDLGLEFCLSWWNDACGGLESLLGGDMGIKGPYFGQLFTKSIEGSWFGGNHGKQTVLALNRQSMDWDEVGTSLLRERGYSDAQMAAFSNEQVRDLARQAYPDRILVFAFRSTPKEILVGEGVV